MTPPPERSPREIAEELTQRIIAAVEGPALDDEEAITNWITAALDAAEGTRPTKEGESRARRTGLHNAPPPLTSSAGADAAEGLCP